MRSIIQQFTNDSWFRRGTLTVVSFREYNKRGRMVKEELGRKTYTRKFFVHTATEKDVRNIGLSETIEHKIVLHLEFALNISDGRPVEYTLDDGSKVQGVTASDEIIYEGYRYKILYSGPWSQWRHWYYIAERINQEGDNVC